MDEERNDLYVNPLCSNAVDESRCSQDDGNIYENFSHLRRSLQEHPSCSCREGTSTQINSVEETDVEEIKNLNKHPKSLKTGLAVLPFSIIFVFFMSVGCLTFFLYFRADILKIITHLNKSHEKLDHEVNESMIAMKSDMKDESSKQEIKLNGTIFSLQEQINGIQVTLHQIEKQIGVINGSEMSLFLQIIDNKVSIQSLFTVTSVLQNISNNTDLNAFLQSFNETLQQQANEIKLLGNVAANILPIRLVGGSENYGRVEIFHNEEWGTICDDYWDIDDANVVCRMLGYVRASLAPGSAEYGSGSGQIWLDDVACDGTELTLISCKKSSWGTHNCGHSEDASVECIY